MRAMMMVSPDNAAPSTIQRDSGCVFHARETAIKRATAVMTVGIPRRQSRQCQHAEENQGRQLAHKDANREIRQRIPCPHRAGVLCGEGPDVGDDEPHDSGDSQQALPRGEGAEEKMDEGDDQEEHPHRGVPDDMTAIAVPGAGTGSFLLRCRGLHGSIIVRGL
mgnify:CR=1 FL=1